MRSIRTVENRARFLDILGQCGNVTATADAIGVARRSLYEWRDDDPVFARDWEAALRLGGEGLEDEARRRAMSGSDLLMMFLLKGIYPERYRERQQIDVNQSLKLDLRKMPREELVRQLEALRAEQPVINGRLIEVEDEVEVEVEDKGKAVALNGHAVRLEDSGRRDDEDKG